jgi:hypothetical protein
MRKFYALMILFAFLPVQARGLEVDFTHKDLIHMGENEFGEINITAENESVADISLLIVKQLDPLEWGNLPFIFRFSDNHFSLTNESKLIHINITVPSYYPPQNFSAYLILPDTNISPLFFEFDIEKESGIEVQNLSYSLNASLNSSLIFPIKIKNTGNIPLNLTMKDNIPFYGRSQKIIINPQQEIIAEISFHIPEDQQPGDYEYGINITGDEEAEIKVAIRFEDKIKPKIEIQGLKQMEIFQEQQIKIEAEDNIQIKNLSSVITFPDNTTKKFNSTFTFRPDQLGIYSVNVTAYDTSNNTASASMSFNVFRKTFPFISLLYDLGKVKRGFWLESTIFSVPQETDFNITLESVEFGGDVELMRDVKILAGGKENNFFLEKGKSFPFRNFNGDFKIKLLAENITGKLNLNLGFGFDEFTDYNTNKTKISVEIVDYKILENFNDTWFNNPVFCKAIDRGSLENSSYKCTIDFPAITEFSQLTLPASPNLINELKNNFNVRLTNKIRELNFQSFMGTVWMGTALVAVLLSVFLIIIYPRLMILR